MELNGNLKLRWIPQPTLGAKVEVINCGKIIRENIMIWSFNKFFNLFQKKYKFFEKIHVLEKRVQKQIFYIRQQIIHSRTIKNLKICVHKAKCCLLTSFSIRFLSSFILGSDFIKLFWMSRHKCLKNYLNDLP